MSRERNRLKGRYVSRRYRASVEALEPRQMLDGSLPSVTVTALDPTADVADGTPGVFAITRSGPADVSFEVGFTLYGDSYDYTCKAGSDPNRVPATGDPGGLIIMSPGQSTAYVFIIPTDPGVDEPEQRVGIAINQGNAYSVGTPSTAIVSIVEDGASQVTVTATTPTADEASGSPGVLTFTRSGPTDQGLQVEFALGGTAQYGVDYTATADGSVRFNPGQSVVTVAITPLDAHKVGGTLDVVPIPVGGDPAYNLVCQGGVTIVDDDVAPSVTVAATTPTADEASLSPAYFTFTRTGPTSVGMQVEYALSGTAQYGVDYTVDGGLLGFNGGYGSNIGFIAFAPGQSVVTLAIRPLDAHKTSGSVSVVLNVMPDPAGYYQVGAASTGSASIADDDTSGGAGSDPGSSSGSDPARSTLFPPPDRHGKPDFIIVGVTQ